MEMHSEHLKNNPQQRGDFLETQEKFKLLQYVCQNLDPYQEISSQMKEILHTLGIVNFDDPFQITNQLIMMMEDMIEEGL